MTEPTPQASPPASSSTQKNVDRATALTEELIDRGAPWSARTSWRIVLGEAIVAGVIGLLILFRPIGGSSTTLQIIGLVLLVGALLTAFQIWRHSIQPGLEVLAAFRAGSGVTVGLVVIAATFFTNVTTAVSASLAVVIGVGFIIFGLAGVAATFVSRDANAPLPLPGLIANAILIVAGVVLLFAGAAGSSTVDSVFTLLGILVIAAAVALAGYAYLLRQREISGLRR